MPNETNDKSIGGWALYGGVCFAAAIAGGLFGTWASMWYRMSFGRPGSASPDGPSAALGLWWGAITGVIAGIVWCRVMVRAVGRDPAVLLTGRGARLGAWVGILSTVLLHAVLIIAAGRLQFSWLLFGLPFGIIVGAVVGAVCGRIWRWLAGAQSTVEGISDA